MYDCRVEPQNKRDRPFRLASEQTGDAGEADADTWEMVITYGITYISFYSFV